MEFVIHRNDLVQELQTVTGVVEKRTTLPILANLLLEAGGKGLEVGASDLEVTIRGTAKATVVREGSVTLPAAKLYDIARQLPEAEVQFKLLDRNQVQISCERTRYRIAGQPRDDFPEFPKVDPGKGLAIPGAALRRMIDRVGFAITTEDPRYSMHGALLLLQKGSITLVATDGYRLAYAHQKAEIAPPAGEIRIIIPRKALTEVAKLAAEVADGEAVVFGQATNQVYFVVGRHVLTTTVPEGSFPKYDEVLPKKCDTSVVVSSADLKDAVKRVSLLASERFGKAVKFHLVDARLELTSETELGDAQEVLSLDYSGEDKTIGFNAKYVLDFLDVVGSPSVRIELDPTRGDDEEQRKRKAGDKPGQFRPEPAGEMDYRYIVMPRDL
jgi:DNA polymerase-3 subunit beta